QGHTNTEFPAAWCPGVIDGENCTQPQLSLSGDLEVLFVSGTFDGRGLDPLFDLNVTADFPGTDAAYTFQCGNPPQQIREPVPHLSPRFRAHVPTAASGPGGEERVGKNSAIKRKNGDRDSPVINYFFFPPRSADFCADSGKDSA